MASTLSTCGHTLRHPTCQSRQCVSCCAHSNLEECQSRPLVSFQGPLTGAPGALPMYCRRSPALQYLLHHPPESGGYPVHSKLGESSWCLEGCVCLRGLFHFHLPVSLTQIQSGNVPGISNLLQQILNAYSQQLILFEDYYQNAPL